MNPKLSERILNTLRGSGTNAERYADYPFAKLVLAELDTLDSQHAALERRVAALEAKPATAGEEWPRWTWNGSFVYRYDSPESCFFYRHGKWYETTLPRACNERDITHEQAIYFCPAIAKTHPLPTVKPPLPVEPAALNDIEAMLRKMPDATAKMGEWAQWLMAESVARMEAIPHPSVASEKARADAAEKRVAELEKAIDGTCVHLAASESEVRRLRLLVDTFRNIAIDMESKLLDAKGDGLPKGAVR